MATHPLDPSQTILFPCPTDGCGGMTGTRGTTCGSCPR